MTRRRKADYVAVIEKLQELFGSFAVEEIMSDFEPAVWSAVRECFPDVKHVGCMFHWSQAVVKTVKRLQLFRLHGEDRKLIYRLLRLPHLRLSDIAPVFNRMWENCSEQLQPLFEYLDRVWINGRWTPKDWCMFRRKHRTNNDQEGNHVKLNQDVGPNVSEKHKALLNLWLISLAFFFQNEFYTLVNKLYKQAEDAEVTARLVANGLDERYQRASQKERNAQLDKLATQLQKGDINREVYLDLVVALMEPKASTEDEFAFDTVDETFFMMMLMKLFLWWCRWCGIISSPIVQIKN